MQPRKCPQCDITISDDANYSFDKELNLICTNCGKIAFPTSWKSNSNIADAVRAKKGGWAGRTWENNSNAQSTFPRQIAGLGIGTNYGNRAARAREAAANQAKANQAAAACASRGPNGKIHGLSGGRSQIPSHTPPFNDCMNHRNTIPHDDVDDYNEFYPFYA